MTNMYFARQATIDGVSFSTIQQGSSGSDVIAWQKIIGVKADGIFGPQTRAATIKWQADHGLAADGIVGPQTWGMASSKALEASVVSSSRTMLVAGGAAGAAALAYWAWKKRKHKRAA